MQVNMLEAKNQLSKLVQAAQKGEDVVIAKNGVPVARLMAFRKPGGLKGWGRLKATAGGLDAAFTPEIDAEIARLMTGDA
ncbi:MAG: type II toxin-antitoxin system prevent-host-death family antitoxin [Sulfuritalea sp.]|nr:type II toxin-antitoxin system prevent-host-death family antitoxin [Sulfuritalea sp.]